MHARFDMHSCLHFSSVSMLSSFAVYIPRSAFSRQYLLGKALNLYVYKLSGTVAHKLSLEGDRKHQAMLISRWAPKAGMEQEGKQQSDLSSSLAGSKGHVSTSPQIPSLSASLYLSLGHLSGTAFFRSSSYNVRSHFKSPNFGEAFFSVHLLEIKHSTGRAA